MVGLQKTVMLTIRDCTYRKVKPSYKLENATGEEVVNLKNMPDLFPKER